MSIWGFELTDIAEGDIAKLDSRVRRRILEKLAWFRDYFEVTTPLPLGNFWKGFFKLRVGDWRIVYSVNFENKKVVVHLIDHRARIYKRKKPSQ